MPPRSHAHASSSKTTKKGKARALSEQEDEQQPSQTAIKNHPAKKAKTDYTAEPPSDTTRPSKDKGKGRAAPESSRRTGGKQRQLFQEDFDDLPYDASSGGSGDQYYEFMPKNHAEELTARLEDVLKEQDASEGSLFHEKGSAKRDVKKKVEKTVEERAKEEEAKKKADRAVLLNLKRLMEETTSEEDAEVADDEKEGA
ncbi:hypothetical protein BDY17DRAFT_325832 [Neohortaea acidophila]|uniref:Uncharacterized protein n=1 Tax=Neohortaea acidophila TaxID=245834 RepID=A0A6A6PNA6_9PEZI|nr:uncharacterized protein BDY17DRAFT_325832 [Neohortaea acidophila]KAF2481114.1 hypothetical protein BDY17DRAFT_325832 [Neohortaea acidophila]